MSRLKDCGAMVYRTDEVGNVVLLIEDGKIYAKTQIELPDQPVILSKENTDGEYIGNIKSYVYHTESCKSLPAEHNREYLTSKEEAESKGYKACGNCNP
ncbi:MAG: Ada metal-binding domain-containing protein [Eubacteriales bacterium]|nr:Ada metal-binding domain-containing protein [Eubacteriales bacterium]